MNAASTDVEWINSHPKWRAKWVYCHGMGGLAISGNRDATGPIMRKVTMISNGVVAEELPDECSTDVVWVHEFSIRMMPRCRSIEI